MCFKMCRKNKTPATKPNYNVPNPTIQPYPNQPNYNNQAYYQNQNYLPNQGYTYSGPVCHQVTVCHDNSPYYIQHEHSHTVQHSVTHF